jgi:hypothetical protein
VAGCALIGWSGSLFLVWKGCKLAIYILRREIHQEFIKEIQSQAIHVK